MNVGLWELHAFYQHLYKEKNTIERRGARSTLKSFQIWLPIITIVIQTSLVCHCVWLAPVHKYVYRFPLPASVSPKPLTLPPRQTWQPGAWWRRDDQVDRWRTKGCASAALSLDSPYWQIIGYPMHALSMISFNALCPYQCLVGSRKPLTLDRGPWSCHLNVN